MRISALSILLPLALCAFHPSFAAEGPAAKASEKIDTSKLTRIDTKVGTGEEAVRGRVVSVHYTGWLYDPTRASLRGEQFDSSRTRGQPFEFPLGGGRVIQGWDQGVQGMKVGGQRTLIIPAALGYGARGVGPIPPNSILLFDVELLGVR
jgi:FKBP-type peptidyl-prolyl cis-trans isomerase FkpA